MHIDTSSIKYRRVGNQKYWLLCVDKATQFKKCFFLHQKDEQAMGLMERLQELFKRCNMHVKYI